jgi:DNA-binding YbaB/EbfC family protein
MRDLMGMMKQAQELQARMQRMQEELQQLEIPGQAGAGLVQVTLNGKGEMRRIRIDPTLMKPDETEILEDLILAASQDAKSKVEVAMQEKMSAVTGGLPLPPGFKLPF